MGSTLVHSILATIVQDASAVGSILVRITEPHLEPVIANVLHERGFVQTQSGWVKVCLHGITPIQQLKTAIQELASAAHVNCDDLAGILNAAEESALESDPNAVIELERLIWPGKISGADVPCFVIPIRPEWAADLFEGRLAKHRLWAADTDLVLNPDSVYYRAAKPQVLSSVGRILWYVSESNSPGSKMLRACSCLTGVVVGKPKELFRRFRRFGVYEWKEVLDTAGAEDGNLMAIEFTNTELFQCPIGWSVLQSVLHTHGRDNYTFPSPVSIDEGLFFSLYSIGSGLESAS